MTGGNGGADFIERSPLGPGDWHHVADGPRDAGESGAGAGAGDADSGRRLERGERVAARGGGVDKMNVDMESLV